MTFRRSFQMETTLQTADSTRHKTDWKWC